MNWEYFNKFEAISDKYLPAMGEGDTMATQIVTAVNKLVYKWYNDGDVYDNTGVLTGWANDLSSYANWLYKHTDADALLECVWKCMIDEDYENLLALLADKMLDEKTLAYWEQKPKTGSIYDCEGPFRFEEYYDEDDEEGEEW